MFPPKQPTPGWRRKNSCKCSTKLINFLLEINYSTLAFPLYAFLLPEILSVHGGIV